MKLRYITFSIIALALLFNITGCSKSPKDKVIVVLTKTLDYISSDEFDKIGEGQTNGSENGHSKYDDQLTKIIKDAGFNTLEDFDKDLTSLKADPAVIELSNKIQSKMMEKMDAMKQMQMDKSYHDMDSKIDSSGKNEEQKQKN